MADETSPSDSLDRILREFLEHKQKGETISAEEFLSRRSSTDPRLRVLLEKAQGWSEGEVDEQLATLRRDDRTRAVDATEHIERTQPLREPEGPPRARIDNRYEVVRLLGEGGFGKVFLVEDTLYSNEKRALKVILPAHSTDPEFEKRFKNEILVLRALGHPGIPQIYNDGKTAKGEFYYTMAFVPGVTLSDVLKKTGPLSPPRIVRIVRQLLAVLDYAHEKGVVHRDLKPSNIMLVDAGSEKEQVKVLDFGIAKVMRHEGAFESAETMNTLAGMGTPHYMSPEQIRGIDVDGRSDIYALGIIIYQMCSGLLPFAGKTAMEIATARLEQAPKPLDTPSTPDWLKELVMKLLERNRERRPRTKQIFEQFERLAHGQRDLRRSIQWVAVGVLAIALGVGWMMWQNRERAPDGLVGPQPVNPGGSVEGPPSGSSGAGSGAPKQPKIADKTVRPRTLTSGQELRTSAITFAGDCEGIARLHVEVHELDTNDVRTRDVAVQTGGTFSQELDLGAGRWHLAAFDGDERSKALLELEFVIDLQRPAIALEPVKGQKIGTDGSEALVDESRIEIQGRVHDAPPGSLSRVTIDGNAVEVASDGSFHHAVELVKVGPRKFVLHAEDKAGNATDEEIVLRYAPDKPKVALMQPASGSFEGRPNEPYLIKGRVLVAPCKRLLLDAKDITDLALTKEDEFAYSVAIPKGTTAFEFTAEDGLGRRSEVVRVTLTGKEEPAPSGTTALAAKDVEVPAGCTRIAGVEIDAATGWPKAVTHTESGIRLVLIPAGHVQRDDGSADVARALYVGQYEVTNEQWARFAASSGRSAAPGGAQKPVTNVSFDDALAFCKWAGLRLPTRAEWIYAACGGKSQDYPWGSTFVPGNCVARDGDADGALAAVGSTPGDKSAFDAYDMAGNVQEWCTDGTGTKPALCGGSFSSSAETCRIGAKISVVTTGGKKSVGFRVVLAP